MLKKMRIVILLICIAFMASVNSAFAEGTSTGTTVTLYLDQTSMKVIKGGVSSDVKLDVPAKAPRGTTLVPVRAVLEAFDSVLSYDPGTRQVQISKGSTYITLTIDSKAALVNGKSVTLIEPAVLENNRTLVPIRFISESLGYEVSWDGQARKITIGSTQSSNETAKAGTDSGKPGIYYAIKSGIENIKSEIDISKYVRKDTTIDEVLASYVDVLNENPEIFYCVASIKYSYNGKLYPEYAVTSAQMKSMKDEFDKKVEQIAKEIIKAGMSDYDKVLAIHDYIIKNSRYDLESLNSGKEIWYNHTAYGVISRGTGVCESYAKAMNLLAKKAGLDCRLISGKAYSYGEWGSHAWNIVRINGKYYHVDVTFDDPVSEDGDVLQYNYLNLSDSEISADHTWDKSGKYPECNSSEYNYFTVKGMLADNYDDFYRIIETGIKQGKKELSIKVVNFDKSKYDVPGTMKKIWRNNSYRSCKYSYGIDEKLGIVSISNIEFN